VLCTDGWLEAGPPAAHHGAEELAAKVHSLSGEELEDLTESLRQDALGRGDGTLRDDLVVLAVRPSARGEASATDGPAQVPAAYEARGA
jgi:hypothetical protein